MKAMRIHQLRPLSPQHPPLSADEVPTPEPVPGELLLQVIACGVCHTELDEIEGRTPPSSLPRTPGHQVVGRVVAAGSKRDERHLGKRVGVAWIHSACGGCNQCRAGLENLCEDFAGCGRDADGGYAEYMCVPAPFALDIPQALDSMAATPLLCAGAVGYRSLALTGLRNGQYLGLTGFGASGHLVLQMARFLYPDSPVFVFARNPDERGFALTLGASWAGDTEETPPAGLDAIIDTTPAWRPIVAALAALAPGGRLVINAIRKEDDDRESLLELDYARHLWHEKRVQSVANVTREDVRSCLDLAARIPLQPTVQRYRLDQANQALLDLRQGPVRGAKVLEINPEA
jgi:propanol-preferring alcohol dehydrogenase